jgi:hypothetical protein
MVGRRGRSTLGAVSEAERRCRSCGALASPDAEWCGQCLRPLGEAAAGPSEPPTEPREPPPDTTSIATEAEPVLRTQPRPEPEPATPAEPGPALTASDWTCPVCQHRNALSAAACEVCGTPFARLFAEPERHIEIEPGRALAWSLLLPGLGHFTAGRRADGVTRMILFAWTFGTVLVMLVSRSSETGFGPLAPLFWLFALAVVALYLTSAVDAWRIAAGEEPLVSSRMLVWAVVVLVVVSAVLATFLTMGVTRGG